jgi:hypothetical protein
MRKELTIIDGVRGVGKDDPNVSNVDPNQNIVMQHTITALAGPGRIVFAPWLFRLCLKDMAPVEILTIEVNNNAKELKADTLKCQCKSQIMPHHHDVSVHGSMWDVLIPPS